MVPCHAVTVVFENASSLARSTVQSPKPLEMTKSGETGDVPQTRGHHMDLWVEGCLGFGSSSFAVQIHWKEAWLLVFAGTGRMAVLSEPIIYLKKSKNGSGSNISQFQCERKNDDDLWPNNM